MNTDIDRLILDTNAIYGYDFNHQKDMKTLNQELGEVLNLAMKMSKTQNMLLGQTLVSWIYLLHGKCELNVRVGQFSKMLSQLAFWH